ncbi:hypothetical protein B0H13DRAFT_2311869 [Mycena leptocephala]|nr:hypothetical protein B0H13DRAFT_2311869 [Mycena leptocephala]
MANFRPAEVAHGPMLLGFAFNAILYGVMILQTHVYFATNSKDPLWMRLYILSIFVLDTMNTFFIFAFLYTSLIVHFDDAPYLRNATWVFATDPALTAIIAAMVQYFFAWRVKVLTNNNTWLYLVVGLCTSVGLVGGIMTIHTGLLTSICAILDLILYLVNPTGLHLIFNFVLAKLYVLSITGNDLEYSPAQLISIPRSSGWGYSKEHGGSGSDGSVSSENKFACLPKPVPPPPPPQAALMDYQNESLLAADPDCMDESKSRPSMVKNDSHDSESTAISVSSAPRKDSVSSGKNRAG